MDPAAFPRKIIRSQIGRIAGALQTATKGRITPDMVTWTAFIAHFIVAYFIIMGDLQLAAVLLVIFGLFDTLDGSLARLQRVDSPRGMFIDAATDRFKEVLIYTAITWYLLDISDIGLVLSVLACGVALSISYVKAKGESAVVIAKGGSHQTINRMFHDGFAAFEIRITLLVIGLVCNQLPLVLAMIVGLGIVTLSQRFYAVYKAL